MCEKQYYYNKLNDSGNDSESTWKTLSSKLRSNVDRPITKLKGINYTTFASFKVSEKFNDYFS